MGFCIDYTDTTITIKREAASLADFFEKVSQQKELLEFLKDGAKTRQAISQGMGLSSNQVGVLLNRAKKKNWIVDIGSGLWKLSGPTLNS